MNKNQPETGIIIEEINPFNEGHRLLVIGGCEFIVGGMKCKGVAMFNFDTGKIERQRRDFDWYNWYHHPTGWDY
tara:strand:+ start:390 stop:611 length:222 start_codon:yes stop_codon:yes gene_type:complete